jgi:hypothetical protein
MWWLLLRALRAAPARGSVALRSLAANVRAPRRLLLPLALVAPVGAAPLPTAFAADLARWQGIALIGALGWLGMALALVPEDVLLRERLRTLVRDRCPGALPRCGLELGPTV